MSSRKWIEKIAFIVGSMAIVSTNVYAQKTPEFNMAEDNLFMALRDSARRDDGAKAADLAQRLENYPIPSYVDYYRIKPRLREVSLNELRNYLNQYDGSAIADRLRNDWLLELGRVRNWPMFDEQYPLFVLDDDLQLKCYALMSKVAKGQNVVEAARSILVSPKDFGEACPSLVSTLAQNGQFNIDDLWAQVRLAAEYGNTALARRYSDLTDTSDQNMIQAIERPAVTVVRGPGTSRASQELFLVALGRLAKSNIELAVSSLTNASQKLNAKQQAIGWAQIALPASQKLMPEAAAYWLKAEDAPLSPEGHQWKVRAALRAGDWKLVQSGIDAMPPSLRSDPAWIYWLGRALHTQGKKDEAQALFQSIKDQHHFYGQLAMEELGQRITIPPQATPLKPEEIAQAAENQGFKRAFKFFELGLRFEAVREWNWQLRRLNERQLLAAAEFARQNGFLDRMVNTSDRTKVELDFNQRFPAPYNDIMHTSTQSLGLDKAWVYGLIRQESRFVTVARSHVGASGLMQIMPATAKYVARKIGMNDFSQNLVNDIQVNITLGTNYLNMVLNELDGSQALATAAYNAGPGRPRSWRSTLSRPVEGAIFAETIPFSETRGYVKNVLSNATYYAALFERKPQSLKARLGMVAPASATEKRTPDLP